MEVCVDSIESAFNAYDAGAERIELCASLSDGGLTPSLGLFKVIKKYVDLKIFVMLRPRSGDFLYSNAEFDSMIEDAKLFMDAGADGFVFGILCSDGTVDVNRCALLLSTCRPADVTFHRAFDFTNDIFRALNDITKLGFNRILTSGGEPSAKQGLSAIKLLIEKAQNSIIIIPGGGINEENLDDILTTTQALEFHSSARIKKSSQMIYRAESMSLGVEDYTNAICCSDAVRNMIKIYKNYLLQRK